MNRSKSAQLESVVKRTAMALTFDETFPGFNRVAAILKKQSLSPDDIETLATERKRFERYAKEAEEYQKTLKSTVPVDLATTDAEQAYKDGVRGSPSCCRSTNTTQTSRSS